MGTETLGLANSELHLIELTFVRRVFGVKSTGSDDWQGIFSGNCHDQQTLQYRLTFYWKIKVILCRNEHSKPGHFLPRTLPGEIMHNQRGPQKLCRIWFLLTSIWKWSVYTTLPYDFISLGCFLIIFIKLDGI